MIIAVDFDGTLCENKYPEIGEPRHDVLDELVRLQREERVKLILWTCRTEEQLDEAVEWCAGQGLYFDAVNENLPEINAKWDKPAGPKVSAHLYLDDLAINVNDFV
jgi:trehalose-6-phosphatase